MLISIVLAIISGIAMSVQGVFNTRVSEKIGLWEMIVIVQGIAAVSAILLSFFFKTGDFHELKNVNKFYLLGGLIGVIITLTVVKSISSMGATLGISIILVAQLLAAALIDSLGLFGSEKITFRLREIIGVLVMISGIIIFKWK